MKAQLTHFETTDHLLLPALLYEPKHKTDKVALYLHGNGSSSIFYNSDTMNPTADVLTNASISFFPFNNRGAHWIKKLDKLVNGKEEESVLYGMTYELIKECINDIDGAINYLKKLGYKTFYLIGVSTGANKIVVYHYYKRKNPIAKYVLLSGGDDVSIYYSHYFKKNKKLFFQMLERCKREIKNGRGRKFVPESIIPDTLISYQSLYDTINPDGDYNIFPFEDYINKLNLTKKKLFREYKTIDKPTLVVYGELDEYSPAPISDCVEVLKKESGSRRTNSKLFTFKIMKGADHGFTGKEKELAKVITRWL